MTKTLNTARNGTAATTPAPGANISPTPVARTTSTTGTSTSSRTHANGAAQAASRRDDDALRLAALQSMNTVAPLPFTDVRGWRVQSSDRQIIGSVSRMLVEQKPAVMPRYLDILVDPAAIGLKHTEPFNLLVPIGRAVVAKGGTGVALPTVTRQDLAALPRLGQGPVSWEFELSVAKAFGVQTPSADPAALYAHPEYDLRAFQQAQPVS